MINWKEFLREAMEWESSVLENQSLQVELPPEAYDPELQHQEWDKLLEKLKS